MTRDEKIEISLPTALADSVREMAEPGRESEFIVDALRFFIEHQRREALRAELIAGYQATADEAIAIAEEWLPLGREAWDQLAGEAE